LGVVGRVHAASLVVWMTFLAFLRCELHDIMALRNPTV
jgi:hypothetical protein